ncbi:type IV secretion system DNA-binding domain-containing protein [Candidatus Dojkabacteria bacterium]|nr:type IV secretion system DNA-binding domain-containing protein [Candidatus Dojkabacteria bacterium]
MNIIEIVLAIMFLAGLAIIAYLLFFNQKEEEEVIYEELRDGVVLHIAVPRENDKTPLAAEQLFASLHGILRNAQRSMDFLSFEIVSTKGTGINFYAVVPKYLMKFVENQIYAQYPNAEINIVKDYFNEPIPETDPTAYRPYVSAGVVELSKDFIFPIKTFRDFEVDPLAAITSALADLNYGEQVMIQLVARPVANTWQEFAKKYIEAIRDGKDPTASDDGIFKTAMKVAGSMIVGSIGFFMNSASTSTSQSKPESKPSVRLSPGQEEELRQISEKMTKVGFELGIRIISKAADPERANQLLNDSIASFKQFTTAHLNSFVKSDNSDKSVSQIYNEYSTRFLSADLTDIVNIEELASIYHLPNISVETPNISWCRAKKSEPPMDLPVNKGAIFAETNYRGRNIPFGILRDDRCLHMYLLGKTGSGKSTLFKNMIISDILSGEGVGIIDPHGDLVDDLLNYIPSSRIDDVVYFDPSDVSFPVGFNLLEAKDPDHRDLIADGVVEVFKKHFGDSWGPRLQYILHNAVLTCVEVQGTTLLAVQRMLIDKNFRASIVSKVKDPVLLKFWNEEFLSMEQNNRLITEAVAPIQNKVGRFLASNTIRNIVGQEKSTIDLREIMDSGKILLVSLSQGRLGEESGALLGGMIVTRLQSTAMERVDIPKEQRRHFFLFVDEFQNYATDSFAKILSEARKYNLALHLTHQYVDQLPETVRRAIFGNVGTIASYVVGPNDAAFLEKEFAPTFDAEDLVSLEKYSLYLKMSINGRMSAPFSARSMDIRYTPGSNKQRVINASREKYGVARSIVEEKVLNWTNLEYSKHGNISTIPKGTDPLTLKDSGRKNNPQANPKVPNVVENKKRSVKVPMAQNTRYKGFQGRRDSRKPIPVVKSSSNQTNSSRNQNRVHGEFQLRKDK